MENLRATQPKNWQTFNPWHINVLHTLYAESPHIHVHTWEGPHPQISKLGNAKIFMSIWSEVCQRLWTRYHGDPDTLVIAPEDNALLIGDSYSPPAIFIINPITGSEVSLLPIPGLRPGIQFVITRDPELWTPYVDFGCPTVAPYFPASIIEYPHESEGPLYANPNWA